MTDEEKNTLSGGVELSFDIPEGTIQNLKEVLGINELDQIHKRFENGTETLKDIMYHCWNYGFELENGYKLKVVETKYFDKLVKYIEKQEEVISGIEEHIQKELKVIEKCRKDKKRQTMFQTKLDGMEAAYKCILNCFYGKENCDEV